VEDDPTNESENPKVFSTGGSALMSTNGKSNSIGVSSQSTVKGRQLPRQVKTFLDGFTEKMAKTKSFH